MTGSLPKTTDELKWASFLLFLAAVYNVAWGAAAVAAPREMLATFGVPPEHRVELWRCIGMFVALYGAAYWFASADPIRYWPFVLVGLAGKMLGPLGAILSIASGALPKKFLWVNVTNDFLWWVPFAWILWMVHRRGPRFAPAGPSGHDASLYRRVLGPAFDELAPHIRRFHDAAQRVEVRGAFRVTRGTSPIGNWLTDRSGFPGASESLDVSLVVDPIAGGETWRRTFGDSVVESRQYQAGGCLVERFGPLVIHLQPRVIAGALEVTDIRSTLLGIPLPPFLTPRVHAYGIDREDGNGIEVTVRVGSSPFGLLVAYDGRVAVV
jgi:small multidrug resistance pump